MTSGLLDSPPEEVFDRLTRLARLCTQAPVALLSLLSADRQFLKSASGMPEPWASQREMPISRSFCKHVVASGAPLIIPDAFGHPLVGNNPAISEMGFMAYLGHPVRAPDGEVIGALCAIDRMPRKWSNEEVAALADLAAAGSAEIARRSAVAHSAELAAVMPHASSGLLADFVDCLEEAFYSLDHNWQFTLLNQAAARFWGKDPEEMVGLSIFEVFPSFAGSPWHTAHKRAMRTGAPVLIEAPAGGFVAPVTIRIFPVSTGLLVFFREVSDLDRIREALRQRNETLTLAEQSAGIGIWDADPSTGLVRGTPQFFRLIGLEPSSEPIPIEVIRSVRHPEDRQRVVEGFRNAVESGADVYESEYRIIRRTDGALRWIFGRGRVLRESTGKPVRYSGIDIDITERKKAEAALRESEERLRLCQEAAEIGIWDWDMASSAIGWSARNFILHGMQPQPTGPSFEQWQAAIHPEDRDRVSAAVAQALVTGTPYQADYRVLHATGETRWLAARGRVFTDEAGRPVRMLGVDLDITDRRNAAEALARMNDELEQRVAERTAALEKEASKRAEAETRLRQAQKMEALGQLTGGVAHDFNNLLTVILGSLDLMQRWIAEAPEDGLAKSTLSRLGRPIDMALQATQSAAQLTHRLLAFSRQQPLQPKLIQVNDLINGMTELITRTLSESIRLQAVLAPDLWCTFADANQLEIALLNLVVNARDAMPKGGELTIETTNVLLGEDQGPERDAPPGDYVMLSVSDTGMGMSKDVAERAFEPFFTTKEPGKGSGLGLSMVYGFVKQSGGYVRIYSEIGHGTSLKIYLPRSNAAKGDTEIVEIPRRPVSRSVPRARAGETILVVEDNVNVRGYSVSTLLDLGYAIHEAGTGDEALRLFHSDPEMRLDLLFTDLVLPDGMNGKQLAERVRALRPNLPILFTTGYARNTMVRHDRLEKGADLISKPFNVEQLARKIRQVLDK